VGKKKGDRNDVAPHNSKKGGQANPERGGSESKIEYWEGPTEKALKPARRAAKMRAIEKAEEMH